MTTAVTEATVRDTKLMWRDDPDAESILVMVGVEWELVDVPLEKIDWHASAENCARMRHPLNEEKILDYEMAMRNGDVFPRVVVERMKNGMFVILGGNQRLNAVKRLAGVASIEAYCVTDIIRAQREAIIRSLNSKHGWETSKEERVEHAVFLVRSEGFSTADAGRLLVVSPESIQNRVRSEDTRRMLASRGIDSNKMSFSHLMAIAKVNDDAIAEDLGRVVEKFEPVAEQVNNVAKAINKARSKAEQAKIIKEFSKDQAVLAEEKPIGPIKQVRRPRRDKFLRYLQTLSEFLERGNDGTGFSTLDELQCSKSIDGDKVGFLCSKIILRLKAIAES